MNDIRPIVSRIAILLPQIISMIIWVQDLHSLRTMVNEIVKITTHVWQLFYAQILVQMKQKL